MPSSYKTSWEKDNRNGYNKKYKETLLKKRAGNPHDQIKRTIGEKYLITERHKDTVLAIVPTRGQFQGTDIEEPKMCEVFGCGAKLNLQEQRFGNKCINHQKQKKVDPTQFISHPHKKSA